MVMANNRATLRRIGVWAAALGAAVCAPAQASVTNAYYERTLMSAAGQRCNLFTPSVASALAAGAAQARGAALRAGTSERELSAVEVRARAKAGVASCRSPDLITAAERVRGAFEGYSRMLKMSYPGEVASWKAERIDSRVGQVWVLSQQAQMANGSAMFGVARRDQRDSLVVVAQFDTAARPYAARLVMRDPRRAPRAYLDNRGAAPGRALPLSVRMAPRSASQTFLAEARSTPDPLIAPTNGKPGLAYRFPAGAMAALSQLDPREAIQIEFLFGGEGPDRTVKALVEVGDFAAGRAFLSVAQR